MTVPIDADHQQFIEEEVKSGRHDSAAAVVDAALSLLRERMEFSAEETSRLRQLLAPALAQAKRGELTPLDMGAIKEKAERQRDARKVV